MQKKYASPKLKQRAYIERKKVREEEDDDRAIEREKAARLDLRFFGESGFERSAESSRDEINIHRQFLRALNQSDVQPGETLRDLARRCWNALLNAEQIGVYESGHDVWLPMFNAKLLQFDAWHGYTVSGALRSGYFDAHWQPPRDGDEAISLDDLPNLPPIKKRKHVDL
jgi:hypothetical protein